MRVVFVVCHMRRAIAISLEESERRCLEQLKRGRRVTVRLAERAAIVLHAADGLENQQIGKVMGITRQKAGRWRQRYAERGLAGIEKDASRPGRCQATRGGGSQDVARNARGSDALEPFDHGCGDGAERVDHRTHLA